MPSLLPLIFVGSLGFLLLIFGMLFRHTDSSIMAIGALLFASFLIILLLSVHTVGKNTMRVLDKNGEPYRVLTSGIHFLAVANSYGTSDFDCSSQQHKATGNISITNEEKSFWSVSTDINWEIICTPENAMLASDLISTPKGENIQDILFREHLYETASHAILQCSPANMPLEETTARAIAIYYGQTANGCVTNFMQQNSDITKILGTSNWQVEPIPKQTLNFAKPSEAECECEDT